MMTAQDGTPFSASTDPVLLSQAAELKKELLNEYWNDSDMHMNGDFEDYCRTMRASFTRALSQGILPSAVEPE